MPFPWWWKKKKPPEGESPPPEGESTTPPGNQPTTPVNQPTTPVSESTPTSMAEPDWLKALDGDRTRRVMIWLRSGWAVTGFISDPNPAPRIFRLHDAVFEKPEDGYKPPQAAKPTSVLVPADQIELITVVSESGQTSSASAAGGTAS
jgi:hypothetical protein